MDRMTIPEVHYHEKTRALEVDGWQVKVTAKLPYVDGKPRFRDVEILSSRLSGEMPLSRYKSHVQALGYEIRLSCLSPRFGGMGFLKEMTPCTSDVFTVTCYTDNLFSIDGHEITAEDFWKPS